MKQRKISLYDVIGVGFMAALVFVSSMISIPIPTVLGISRIHLGNAFCLLAGFLLGGFRGGLAAGIGSMLYDFTNPVYIAESPITFVNKFMMAFVCGSLAAAVFKKGTNAVVNRVVSASSGALTYVVLYLTKNFIKDVFFLHAEVATALIDIGTKAMTSLTNAAIAVIISVPLSFAIRNALKRSQIYQKMMLR
jgi:uncharacterized membrane protein